MKRDLTHPHTEAVRAYLDNAGITPDVLRYAATHESLCRSWIFDLLTGLADTMETDLAARRARQQAHAALSALQEVERDASLG